MVRYGANKRSPDMVHIVDRIGGMDRYLCSSTVMVKYLVDQAKAERMLLCTRCEAKAKRLKIPHLPLDPRLRQLEDKLEAQEVEMKYLKTLIPRRTITKP